MSRRGSQVSAVDVDLIADFDRTAVEFHLFAPLGPIATSRKVTAPSASDNDEQRQGEAAGNPYVLTAIRHSSSFAQRRHGVALPPSALDHRPGSGSTRSWRRRSTQPDYRIHTATPRGGIRSVGAIEQTVGGHEILPGGGQVAARVWPPVLPTGGQWFCPLLMSVACRGPPGGCSSWFDWSVRTETGRPGGACEVLRGSHGDS